MILSNILAYVLFFSNISICAVLMNWDQTSLIYVGQLASGFARPRRARPSAFLPAGRLGQRRAHALRPCLVIFFWFSGL